MAIIHRTKSSINGSTVEVDVVDNLTWEELVIFRAKTNIHQIISERKDIVIPTYRGIKDWLIKEK
jgi:hypothetical protein